MKKYKAVLLDFDGTIMDTNRLILNSWQYTYRKLTGKEGDEKTILSTFGEILYDSMEKFFPEQKDEAVATYREYQKYNFEEEIELFPGMKEAIEEMKKKGYLTALVTSRLARTTMLGVKKFGLGELLDTIVTEEDTEGHKPLPDPAQKAMERLGVSPSECIMIGDSKYDLMCAHNAGMEFILVSWSAAAGELEKMDEKPDHVIDSAEDLFKII